MRSEEEIRQLLALYERITKRISEKPESLMKASGGQMPPIVANIHHLVTLNSMNEQMFITRWMLGEDNKLLEGYQQVAQKLESS